MRDFARSIERQLADKEEEHISEYIHNGTALVDLYQHIQSCDSILGSMEDLLSGFQSDLGQLSTEIQSLQSQSLTLSHRLKHRLAVRQQLGEALEGLALSPDIIRIISNGEVNDEFMEALLQLNAKMTYVKLNVGKQFRAFKDIGPEMERLRLKATEKIRAFLLDKLKQLLVPNANVAVVQLSVLSKYKPLYHFLIQRHLEAATEIRLTYTHILSGYYHGKFAKYANRMQKLQSVIADKLDLIGLDDSAKKGLFGGNKMMVKDKTNVFTLGERIDILNAIDAPVILPHVAEEQQLKFPFEAIFRSMTRTFMDNASSEFVFDLEFFYAPRSKKSENPTAVATDAFNEVFGKTLKMILESVKAYAESSFDAVGVLLCIRINQQHQLIMQKRRIPCLDAFLNAVGLLLWPRFTSIMDMHINSVKKAVASGASNFFSGTVDIHPHYVTRRYAEFASSILLLNEGYHDHLLENSLGRLRVEVESLVGRLAADFQDRKKKLTFLINNYDLVISILEKYETSTIKAERDHFIKHLENRILEYVDQELQPYFGGLMSFVADLEKVDSVDKVPVQDFERVAKEFSGNWKTALQDINTSILQSFTNFRNGTLVLHTVLKQLVFYYQTFLVYWEKRFPPGARTSVQPVMMHQLVVEIKTKYKSNF